jgi:DNA-binding LacI/PurR family transcriptional regulator
VLAIASRPLDHVATYVFDQALVGEVAMAHLIERGHTRIVVLMPSEARIIARLEETIEGKKGRSLADQIAPARGSGRHHVNRRGDARTR